MRSGIQVKKNSLQISIGKDKANFNWHFFVYLPTSLQPTSGHVLHICLLVFLGLSLPHYLPGLSFNSGNCCLSPTAPFVFPVHLTQSSGVGLELPIHAPSVGSHYLIWQGQVSRTWHSKSSILAQPSFPKPKHPSFIFFSYPSHLDAALVPSFGSCSLNPVSVFTRPTSYPSPSRSCA